MKSIFSKSVLAGAAGLLAAASVFAAPTVGPVFVIALENRNFAQPAAETFGPQIYGNTADAPYINSLITPGNPNAQYVSWTSTYHHVLSQPTGNSGGTTTLSGGVANGVGNTSVHPSEPNYLWYEAGSNYGVLNDNDPYATGVKLSPTGTATGTQIQVIQNYIKANPSVSGQHLRGLLQTNGVTWNSYQEGVDLQNSTGGNGNLGGNLTATPLAEANWTVPLGSFSGNNASYTNPYNGHTQWNFAVKHEGALLFTDTNGSTATTANTATSNLFADSYRPLAQLATDLIAGNVAEYNFITPDQFNDMHTALSSAFSYNSQSLTGAHAQIAQGDNFLAQIIPIIMASDAFQNQNAVIIIWTDETESSLPGSSNNSLANDFGHTLCEIVISKQAKGNAYESKLNYTHSSDLNTLQKIFQVSANTATGFLNDAAYPSNSSGSLAGTGIGYGTGPAYDLSDLFQPGVIPTTIPAATSNLVDVAQGALFPNRRTGLTTQTVTVTNNTGSAISGNVYLAIDSLSSNTSAHGVVGLTASYAPTKSPYVLVSSTGLAAGASQQVILTFTTPTSGAVNYTPRVVVPQGGTTDNGNP